MARNVRKPPAIFNEDEQHPVTTEQFRQVLRRSTVVAATAKPVILYRIAELVQDEEDTQPVRSQFIFVKRFPVAAARPVILYRAPKLADEEEVGTPQSQFFKVGRSATNRFIEFRVGQPAPDDDSAPVQPYFIKVGRSATNRFIPFKVARLAPEDDEQPVEPQFFYVRRVAAAVAARALIPFMVVKQVEDDPEWSAFKATTYFPYVTAWSSTGRVFYGGPTFTEATKPTNASQGSVILVSDGAAGSKFQGRAGSGWVGLG